jgi:hypothetical protein
MNEEVVQQESLTNQARLSIPGDTVKIALTKMRDSKSIDEADEAIIWWFYCQRPGRRVQSGGWWPAVVSRWIWCGRTAS